MSHRYASNAPYYTNTPPAASWVTAILLGHSPRINRGPGRGEKKERRLSVRMCPHLCHLLPTISAFALKGSAVRQWCQLPPVSPPRTHMKTQTSPRGTSMLMLSGLSIQHSVCRDESADTHSFTPQSSRQKHGSKKQFSQTFVSHALYIIYFTVVIRHKKCYLIAQQNNL